MAVTMVEDYGVDGESDENGSMVMSIAMVDEASWCWWEWLIIMRNGRNGLL